MLINVNLFVFYKKALNKAPVSVSRGTAWTEQESNELIRLVKMHGSNSLGLIAVTFTNRSEIGCRVRAYNILKEMRKGLLPVDIEF